jgi:regulator of replication initiation timing
MIQRNKGVPDWMLGENKLERKSVSDGAMSAFANSVLQQANDMKKAGKSDAEIAKAFNVEKDTLKKVLREATADKPEVKCSCEDEEAIKAEYKAKLADAEQVRHDLRGSKAKSDADAPLRRGGSIMSAKGGRMDISNEVGSNKVMGSDTNNSIWDSEKLTKASKTMDNGERIRRERDLIEKRHQENKKLSRNTTIDGDSLKDALSGTDQRKDSSIKGMNVDSPAGYSKNLPQNGMSIFDDGFARISEKTRGEQMSEEVRKPKEKDRSWVADGAQQVTAKSLLSKMIDTMLEGKQTKSKE